MTGAKRICVYAQNGPNIIKRAEYSNLRTFMHVGSAQQGMFAEDDTGSPYTSGANTLRLSPWSDNEDMATSILAPSKAIASPVGKTTDP